MNEASQAQGEAARQRLYWQCRRGMLELDLLLMGFLDKDYARLDASQRQAFERLLGCPDQLLLEYLLGRMTPMDGELADVVSRIRAAT